MTAEIFPSNTEDNRRCYFIDLLGPTEEIRVKTVDDVVQVLQERQSSAQRQEGSVTGKQVGHDDTKEDPHQNHR